MMQTFNVVCPGIFSSHFTTVATIFLSRNKNIRQINSEVRRKQEMDRILISEFADDELKSNQINSK
jgi:hypothetical protein